MQVPGVGTTLIVIYKLFSSVLPTSRVGYHAGKHIESVVYCLIIVYLYISYVFILVTYLYVGQEQSVEIQE